MLELIKMKINSLDNLSEEFWEDAVVRKYGADILLKYNRVPLNLRKNSLLLEIAINLYLNNQLNYNILEMFYNEAWTDRIVISYGLLIIKKYKNIPVRLRKNNKLLELVIIFSIKNIINPCILEQFYLSAWKQTIIDKYGMILITSYMPSKLKNNSYFFKFVLDKLEQNELDNSVINFFTQDAYTDEIIMKYGTLLKIPQLKLRTK